ncbi:hypothetical protein N9L06_06865 [Mariniblastus sp.]|nr:hypothetical protein [Mariniblastus sp.]
MKFDLEGSFVGTIRDDIPKLESPEQMRKLVVDGDAVDEGEYTHFTFAQRIENKLRITWIEGEDEDQKHTADLRPRHPNDSSDLDHREWEGSIQCSYIRYDGGWHADQAEADTDRGLAAGWMFEDSEGCCFVGQFDWKSGETERVVIQLFEKS